MLSCRGIGHLRFWARDRQSSTEIFPIASDGVRTEQEPQMRILVTGGTGHLGRVVVARLTEEGHQVRVLARRPCVDPSVEWITGALATGDGVRGAVDGVDTIVHAATRSPAAQRGRFR